MLKGDFGALQALIKNVANIERPATMRRLNKNLAQEARNQMVIGFEQMRDPYGVPWAKTKRGGQILRDTGRMMNSVKPDADEHSFNLSTNVVYAPVHQYGFSRAPFSRVRGAKRAVNAEGKPISKRVAARRKKLGLPVGMRTFKPATFGKGLVIPQRMFLPAEGSVGIIWMTALEAVMRAHMLRIMTGK